MVLVWLKVVGSRGRLTDHAGDTFMISVTSNAAGWGVAVWAEPAGWRFAYRLKPSRGKH